MEVFGEAPVPFAKRETQTGTAPGRTWYIVPAARQWTTLIDGGYFQLPLDLLPILTVLASGSSHINLPNWNGLHIVRTPGFPDVLYMRKANTGGRWAAATVDRLADMLRITFQHFEPIPVGDLFIPGAYVPAEPKPYSNWYLSLNGSSTVNYWTVDNRTFMDWKEFYG